MPDYLHPTQLNELKRYQQAAKILRETSRASNPAWYGNALELGFQLHLRVDGLQVESWLFDPRSGAWAPGPALTEAAALDPAGTGAGAFAAKIIELARAQKARAAGVILHLADEFATAELKRDLHNPGALDELRERIVTRPATVLDDASVAAEEYSFRLIPYAAQGSEAIATAVTISHRWAGFLESLRHQGEEHNFPIVTRALSAPLTALLALPEIKRDAVTRPLLAVLPYRRFTALAFFNAHGELLLLRSLQHRGQRGPANFRHTLTTTTAALELADPEILLAPTLADPDPRMLADLEQISAPGAAPAVESRSGLIPAEAPPAPTGEVPLELRTATASRPAGELISPLAASHTFTTLRGDGWAVQDFLPVPRELAEVFPSRGEMRLLRAGRYLRYAFALFSLLAIGWLVFSLFGMVRQPEWAFREEDSKTLRNRQMMFTMQKNRIEHWDNLLEDRAKAWTGMELLARLAPENGGLLVKTFVHSAQPTAVPGQAKVGFVKEWRVSGLAREAAAERLSLLNTREATYALFDEIARSTGNDAFRTDLTTRNIVATIRTQENSGYKPGPEEERRDSDESSYPFTFDLVISQRFESTDPMAINSTKAP